MSTLELQKRLTDLGYKPGAIDGMMGPRTTAALKRFQHDHKLSPTGKLDTNTAAKLRAAQPK